MNRSFYIYALLILIIITSIQAIAKETITFVGETLFYSAKFNGMSTAKSTLACTRMNSNHIQIQWDLKSKWALRFLFSVDNQYTSLVNSDTWQTESFEKKVKQKNIKQSFTTTFNREQNTAFTNNGLEWPSPKQSMDILSMLYHMRLQKLNPGDSLNYIIDLESHIWQVSGTVTQQDDAKGQNTVTLIFSPKLPIIDRPWKTDLMTNRISKTSTQLTIHFRTTPAHVPLYLKFENSDSTVEMDLDTEEIE